jgi:hypothetical protein
MKNLAEITTPPVAGDREEPKCWRHDDTEPYRRRREVIGAIIPFLVQRDWYQRYWLDEGPGCVQEPLLQARIGMAAKRILRMFRPMRNGRSASVDAAVRSSRGDIDG